jgi:hypothetical protein
VFGVDDRAIKKDLANFKKFIENPANQGDGWRGNVDR